MNPDVDTPPRGWFSRGYLPHFDSSGVIQHVTYRLSDSLPADVLAEITRDMRLVPAERRDATLRRRIEDWIDAGHGCCLLRDPTAAHIVQDSFLHNDGVRYRLLAWVVMSNHVHVLFEPCSGWPLAKIVGTWRSYTGRRLAPMMPTAPIRDGSRRVWARGYWDRFIRDEHHYAAALAYIHANPVKARLAKRAEDWPWGSASDRQGR